MSILENYRREIGCLKENALDSDFNKPKIDEEARRITQREVYNYGDSIRINHGLFYTDEEREKIMEELLKVKLP